VTKKIIAFLIILLSFFAFSNIEAANTSNFFDMQSYNNIYKMSEESDVELPFLKVFDERATFDKKLNKSGITIAAKAVEILDDVDGVQTIFTADTVNIKGNIEYGVVMSSNVEISGTVEKDIVIFSESVFITESANILGDIIVMANTIEMKGNVQGNFIGNSIEFLMAGNVEKDFRVCSEKMTFEETNIKGDIYIETNSDLDISNKYENAVINKIKVNTLTKEERKNEILKIVMDIITGTLLFTLAYLVTTKAKPELFKNLAERFLAKSSVAVLLGVIVLITIPIILILSVMCSWFGAGIITTPLTIMYLSIILVTALLSKFILGSVIYELLKAKISLNTKIKEIAMLIAIYAVIFILCNISYISGIATVATVLLSVGIVASSVVKNNK